jgi:hypothetical protein
MQENAVATVPDLMRFRRSLEALARPSCGRALDLPEFAVSPQVDPGYK